MALDLDIGQTSTTDLTSAVDTFNVSAQTPDSTDMPKLTSWDYPDSDKYLGYYKEIPELQKATQALALWVAGKGFETSTRNKIVLENVTGWGEDSMESIVNNLIVQKKIFGDAFAEIIRNDEGMIVNLKPLYTGNMKVFVTSQGIIERYEHKTKVRRSKKTKFQPHEILHLVNDRITNEIHGISVIESVQWVIDARQEAMRDLRLMINRSKAMGVLEIDTENTGKRDTIIKQYEDMINKGEVIVLPKGVAELKEANLTRVQIQEIIGWIKYLENYFYVAVGIPKVILGGSEEFTEASSKIAYLSFEQVYMKEQRELEADFWNQLAVRLVFKKPASLKNELLDSEEKNTGQVQAAQSNDVTAGVGE